MLKYLYQQLNSSRKDNQSLALKKTNSVELNYEN